jgi:phosphoribosylanthranilate isomerase
MTLVKICGLTRPEDVALACALGARYVGFNFAQSSPRRVSAEAARTLADAAAEGVLRVGIFQSESDEAIDRAVALARLDLVQLHRTLTREDLDRSPVPVIAVVRESRDGDGIPDPELLRRCHAVLLDASEGRGRPLDPLRARTVGWPVPVFVAGGLDADSVGPVIRALKPAAVDVATGAESAPGIKDRDKLARLFDAVREADREG